jgi:hypothetical protein
LVPVPGLAPSELSPPFGAPGVLSGGMVVPLVAPDLVPAASVPSLAAKLAADAEASSAASKSEVSLRVIMVRLLEGDLPDIGLARLALGADCLTSGLCPMSAAYPEWSPGLPADWLFVRAGVRANVATHSLTPESHHETSCRFLHRFS